MCISSQMEDSLVCFFTWKTCSTEIMFVHGFSPSNYIKLFQKIYFYLQLSDIFRQRSNKTDWFANTKGNIIFLETSPSTLEYGKHYIKLRKHPIQLIGKKCFSFPQGISKELVIQIATLIRFQNVLTEFQNGFHFIN